MFDKHIEPPLGSRSAEPSGADYAVPDGDADPLLLETRLHAAALVPALAGAVGSVAIAAAGVALLAHSSAPTVVRAAFDLALVALGIRFVVAAVRSTWRWERSALRVTARELVLRQRPQATAQARARDFRRPTPAPRPSSAFINVHERLKKVPPFPPRVLPRKNNFRFPVGFRRARLCTC